MQRMIGRVNSGWTKKWRSFAGGVGIDPPKIQSRAADGEEFSSHLGAANADWKLDPIVGAFAAAGANLSWPDALEIASDQFVEAALAAFEMNNSPAMMLDQFGRVLNLNESAKKILGKDIFIRERRVRSAWPEINKALDEAISRLIQEVSPAMLPPIVMSRTEGRPVLAYLSRPAGIAIEALSRCRGLILFVDPDRALHRLKDESEKLFGLSPAESRLAAALMKGQTLETTAHDLKISYETARTTLKHIFNKTGTERQSELLALLTRIALSVPSPMTPVKY